MISKNDLVLLLAELEAQDINVKSEMNRLFKSEDIPLDVLKFINEHRQFEVANFYEMLRKNYNQKKSPLYKNIVKEEYTKASEVLSTLAALHLQIVLYANKLDDNKLFLTHSRASEITDVLSNYYKTYDLIPCYKLLKLIKTDLKVFESIR